jgi:WD40 repeat protein
VSALGTKRPGYNPYPGPRAFHTGETLYGRDNEIFRLLDRLMAERIVLFFSPSGAGKTSLIQAGLVPRLREEGFYVRPVIRVSRERQGDHSQNGHNRYVDSMISCLENGTAPAGGRPGKQSLPDCLTLRPEKEGDAENEVLIFDQFEELLTLDPTDRPAKEEFLAAVGAQLRDRRRWALFSMREDFVPGLDPYLRWLPTRLRTTFRLDFLGGEAARLAMQCPAQDHKVSFSDSAVDRLIDDLRRVQVQRPEGIVNESGPYIEPVQLQVVCRRLWEHLPPEATVIDEDQVRAMGNVDSALADYYDEQLDAIEAETGASQRAIRDWFDEELLTPQGFRNQVLKGPVLGDSTKETLRHLENAHLIRGEKRRGALWWELTHDRLVEPVVESNRRWRESHLSMVERQAKLWDSEGRPDDMLLTREALQEAESWAAAQPAPLPPLESQFLADCRQLRDEILRKRRQGRWMRRLAVAATVVSVIAAIALVLAARNNRIAQRAVGFSEARELGASALNTSDFDRRLSILLALKAMERAGPGGEVATVDARTALYRAVSRPNSTAAETTNPSDIAPSPLVAPRPRLTFPQSGVRQVAFDPAGRRLVTASIYGWAIIWDIASRTALHSFKGDGGSASAVAFSPDGGRVATAGADGTAKVWDASTGSAQRSFRSGDKPLSSVAFASSVLAAASGHGVAVLWDVNTGKELFTVTHKRVTDVALNPDGTLVATGGNDGTAKVWKATDGTLVASFEARGSQGTPNDQNPVAFSHDGTRLATAGPGGTARIWDIASQQEIRVLPPRTRVQGIVFNRDGSRIATADADGYARVWAVDSGSRLLKVGGTSGPALSVAFSPDEQTLAVATAGGPPALWSLGQGPVIRDEAPVPDGRSAVPPGGGDGDETIMTAVAMAPDGRRVVTAGPGAKATVWQISGHDHLVAGQPRELPHQHGGGLKTVAFSPNGKLLVSAGDDGRVVLWDGALTGQPPTLVQDLGAAIRALDFGADSRWLAAGGADGTVNVWDVSKRARPKRCRELQVEPPVVAVALGSEGDGRHSLVAVGGDGIVSVRGACSGKVERFAEDSIGAVKGVASSVDGNVFGLSVQGGPLDVPILISDARDDSKLTGLYAEGEVVDLAFRRGGREVAAATTGGVVAWDVKSRRQSLRIDLRERVAGLSFSGSGKRLAVASGPNLFLYTLDRKELMEDARAQLFGEGFTPQECLRYLRKTFDDCLED